MERCFEVFGVLFDRVDFFFNSLSGAFWRCWFRMSLCWLFECWYDWTVILLRFLLAFSAALSCRLQKRYLTSNKNQSYVHCRFIPSNLPPGDESPVFGFEDFSANSSCRFWWGVVLHFVLIWKRGPVPKKYFTSSSISKCFGALF